MAHEIDFVNQIDEDRAAAARSPSTPFEIEIAIGLQQSRHHRDRYDLADRAATQRLARGFDDRNVPPVVADMRAKRARAVEDARRAVRLAEARGTMAGSDLASVLARIAADKGLTTEQRIGKMFEMAFSRQPSAKELADVRAFAEEQGRQYGNVEDPRVWADVAHVLFNVKEFIFVP